MTQRIVILIPALNEETTIASVVSLIRIHCDAHIVVIDDAGTDRTAQNAFEAGAVVLPLAIRLGAWGAMRTGFRYAKENNFDIVVTMDADGQHRPEHLADLVAPIQKDWADLVIGSCVDRGNWSRKISWRFFRWLTGIDVADLTSGFRAYNRAAVDIVLGSETSLLEYQDIGVLLAAKKAGLRLMEIPVTMCSRQEGESRIYASWLGVLRYMVWTLVFCLSKWDRLWTGRVRSIRGA